jgi:integrase
MRASGVDKMVDKIGGRYLYRKRGVYYFSRHVPVDVRQHHECNRIVICLKTKSVNAATRAATEITNKLDDYWLGLRLKTMPISVAHPPTLNSPAAPTLSDALTAYLALKAHDKGPSFVRTATRNVGYVIAELGDRPIDSYTSLDAARFRDALFARGLSSSSAKRIFGSVRAITTLVLSEHGLDLKNPFTGTYLPDRADARIREPIPLTVIRHIQQDCQELDDDRRWIIALLSDTGMRLAEAVGLCLTDLVVNSEIPHVIVQPHAWRTLKTKASSREIPLVGAALWAARRAHANATSEFAFPRYCNRASARSDHASATLNKWLKPRVPKSCVIHSFRHSMRDRLRTVECPADVIDQIGGWSRASVGLAYGRGYTLPSLSKWMRSINAISDA